MGRVMHACNISMHAICSPKILHLNIVFISPREDLISPRKNCETMVKQPLWGKQGVLWAVHYWGIVPLQ